MDYEGRIVNFDRTAMTEVSVEIQLIPDTIKRVGRLHISFEGIMLGRRDRFEIFYTMDRRQARRVARRLGRTFRWRKGEARWR